MTNCYNPGWDLEFSKDEPCKKQECKKTYATSCMYNTQGQYVCQKKEEHPNLNDGWNYIMGDPYVTYKSDKPTQEIIIQTPKS